MDENVISWNLPNVVSILLMFMIIWIIFGSIGHFFFRNSSSSDDTNVVAQPQVLGV